MRKVQDHYFLQAKKEGYPSRAVYKLAEIDRRHRLLRPGLRVLDLGSAPGSWLLYAAKKTGATGAVWGIDLSPLKGSFSPWVKTFEGDICTPELWLNLGQEGPFDLILSDMAPKTSGIKSLDSQLSINLAHQALALAPTLLKPQGNLLVKVFQGGDFANFRLGFGLHFRRFSLEKPKASRAESAEIFLLGQGYEPQTPSSLKKS